MKEEAIKKKAEWARKRQEEAKAKIEERVRMNKEAWEVERRFEKKKWPWQGNFVKKKT
jgi:hypothetical protein